MKTLEHPALGTSRSKDAGSKLSPHFLLFASILSATCLVCGITALGLTGPDEPRYFSIARAMARTGDWITPKLLGQPWFEKPVLYYWFAGVAVRLFGDAEMAARLPSVLGAFFTVAVTAWAAMRFYGPAVARLTLLIVPTTVGLISFSHAASPDMLFTAFLTATAVCVAQILHKNRPSNSLRVALGIFLGAATLAKGPAAVLLAGAATVLAALLAGNVRAALRCLHPLCIGAFAVVAVPWYALCALRNPDFLRIFFLEHNFQRYFTPVFQHPQPFWFFAPILILATLPWSVLLVPLTLDAIHERKSISKKHSTSLFFACWALVPFLFFSFSQSKLPSYILPCVPPLAIILAATLARHTQQTSARSRLWPGVIAVTLPIMSAAALFWLQRFPPASGLPGVGAWTVLLALLACGGLISLLLVLMDKVQLGIATVCISFAALVAATSFLALPRLDPYLSARPAVRILESASAPSDHVFVFAVDRSLQIGLEFYLDRVISEWPATGASKPAWIWTTSSHAPELQRQNITGKLVAKLSPEAWLFRVD